MPRDEGRSPDFVEALAKGLAILEAFDATHPEMTLSEVARRVGLSRPRRSVRDDAGELGLCGCRDKRFHSAGIIAGLRASIYAAACDKLLHN